MNQDKTFQTIAINAYLSGYFSISGVNPWKPINNRGYSKWKDGGNNYTEYCYFEFGRKDKLSEKKPNFLLTTEIQKIENKFVIHQYDVNLTSTVVVINGKESYNSSYEASVALENHYSNMKKG